MPRKKSVRKQPGKRLPKLLPKVPGEGQSAQPEQQEQPTQPEQSVQPTQSNQPKQPTLSMSAATESKIRPEIATLKSKMAVMEKEFQSAQAVLQKYTNEDPDELIKRHIALLHEYNDIKDAAMGLVGVVADGEGRTIKDVLADLGIDEKDEKTKKNKKK